MCTFSRKYVFLSGKSVLYLWLGGGGPGQGESVHQEPEGVQDHLSRLQGSTTILLYRGQDTQVMGVSGKNE